MPSPTAPWRLGLQPDISAEAVYQPFRDLLKSHLPMTQEELAKEIDRDRTTVNRWKSERSSEPKAGLSSQRSVINAVRTRLLAIRRQTDRVERLIKALEGVGTAQRKHSKRLDSESLGKLSAANDGVRALLGQADE